jgi:hypothetical protein
MYVKLRFSRRWIQKLLFSGMRQPIVSYKDASVSEDPAALFFTVHTLRVMSNYENMLKPRRIRCSHSDDYEEFFILEYNAVQSVGSQSTFRRNIILLPSSGSKNKPSKKPAWKQTLLATFFPTSFLLGLFFDCENGNDTLLLNVGWLSMDYMALHPRS